MARLPRPHVGVKLHSDSPPQSTFPQWLAPLIDPCIVHALRVELALADAAKDEARVRALLRALDALARVRVRFGKGVAS